MIRITMAILDKKGRIKEGQFSHDTKQQEISASGEDFVQLALQNYLYEEGDEIKVTLDRADTFLVVKLDETLDSTMIYIKEKEWRYVVKRTQNALEAAPKFRFAGNCHYLQARVATLAEVRAYRNIALNPHDQKNDSGAYPHARANVETREDATFFACNAIDGIFANRSHGNYPYGSWGINQQADAALTIEFGKEVQVDRVRLTLRADFPHDNYWKKVTAVFSDGSSETFETKKTDIGQSFDFEKRETTCITLCELIQSDDPSPFPALTQVEVFGYYEE
ncbi:hypothetical protein A5886_000490 [Enterococcus sp. 8G7_MSG3316]|uniref:Uncharacterized protein n=1 Tax=Candidatus Enterococcus testudinis TaxID=1834191 RepID=A0A242A3E7_9ENTE|nr:hypothetical protein [Enterococcus sp. 8G7_MSG3316]OTN75420.1 hypothetical protein A5886_000490 [Enterococcus sp. 8G7_MSG3316]